MTDKATTALQGITQRLQQHMEIILTLHQSYSIKKTIHPYLPAEEHIITIVKMGIYDIDFTITGPGVVDPERPRSIPIAAFVKWLELMHATPITHEDTQP